VRDNSPKMVMADLAKALDKLEVAFPGRDLAQEQLGSEVIRSFIGQYGIRKDELVSVGLTFGSTVSSTRSLMEKSLHPQAA